MTQLTSGKSKETTKRSILLKSIYAGGGFGLEGITFRSFDNAANSIRDPDLCFSGILRAEDDLRLIVLGGGRLDGKHDHEAGAANSSDQKKKVPLIHAVAVQYAICSPVCSGDIMALAKGVHYAIHINPDIMVFDIDGRKRAAVPPRKQITVVKTLK